MFTNITKMIMPMLFVGLTSQAMSTSHQEFEENEVYKIHFQVDKSNISFHMSDNDKLQIEHQIVNYNSHANILMKVDDGTLKVYSTNQYFDGCEVNYIVKIPNDIDVKINGGYVKIDSDASLTSLSLYTGILEGRINNPYCDMKIKTGQGDIKISYDKIRDKISELSVNVKATMGSGCMNISFPSEATVHYKVNVPSSTASNNFYSDFSDTEDDPDFNLKFQAGAGKLKIFKHAKQLLD